MLYTKGRQTDIAPAILARLRIAVETITAKLQSYENEDQEDRDRFDAYTLPTRVEAFDADKEPGVERTVKLISARDFRKARSSDAFSSIS